MSPEEFTAAQEAFKKQDAALYPLHRAWVASAKKVDELNDAWRSWTNEITEDGAHQLVWPVEWMIRLPCLIRIYTPPATIENGLNRTWEKLSIGACLPMLENSFAHTKILIAQHTDLPTRERLCVEKAGIWVAYFLYELFVAGPNAKEAISSMRWLLSLIPWWPLRQVSLYLITLPVPLHHSHLLPRSCSSCVSQTPRK